MVDSRGHGQVSEQVGAESDPGEPERPVPAPGHDRREVAVGRHRRLLDQVDHVVYETDGQGRLTFLNKAWSSLTGFGTEDCLGHRLDEYVETVESDDGEAWLAGRLEDDGDARYRASIGTATGGRRIVRIRPQRVRDDGGPEATIGTIIDVTEELDREVELRHAQKLEAVGSLASGIAHEINTPIQFVGDNLRFLRKAFARLTDLLRQYRLCVVPDAPEVSWRERASSLAASEQRAKTAYLEHEIPKAVEQALEGAERVASIVQAMKMLGHPDSFDQQAVDLSHHLRNTLIVSRNEYKYVADVVTDFADLPPLVCFASDINQVFLNLVVNAAHAIGDRLTGSGERGQITVRTARDGDFAVVTVADTGTGIPEAIQGRVYEPFFTTKPVGRGTGQGLALVRSIVDRHEGSISFETGSEGTEFTVRLPLAGIGRSSPDRR